jgi:hypothetical protein
MVFRNAAVSFTFLESNECREALFPLLTNRVPDKPDFVQPLQTIWGELVVGPSLGPDPSPQVQPVLDVFLRNAAMLFTFPEPNECREALFPLLTNRVPNETDVIQSFHALRG